MSTTTEFNIDFSSQPEGVSSLIVTHASVLIPDAVPGKHHRYTADHNAHACHLLSLGNDHGWCHPTHILTREDSRTASKTLNRVFNKFVDTSCLEFGCHAYVSYTTKGVQDFSKNYGDVDTDYRMRFHVHCGVTDDIVDEFIERLISYGYISRRHIVVRPDASPDGYVVQHLETSPEVRYVRITFDDPWSSEF